MKDVKSTLRAIVKHEKGTKAPWRAMSRRLWRTYTLLAVAVAALASSVRTFCCTIVVPMTGFRGCDGTIAYSTAEQVMLYGITGVCLIAAVGASVLAHKAMRNVVTGYPEKTMSTKRRNMLRLVNTLLVIGTLTVAFLPALTVFISAITASSIATPDTPAIPTWGHIAFCLTTFFGMLAVEAILTFVRLTFREITVEEQS